MVGVWDINVSGLKADHRWSNLVDSGPTFVEVDRNSVDLGTTMADSRQIWRLNYIGRVCPKSCQLWPALDRFRPVVDRLRVTSNGSRGLARPGPNQANPAFHPEFSRRSGPPVERDPPPPRGPLDGRVALLAARCAGCTEARRIPNLPSIGTPASAGGSRCEPRRKGGPFQPVPSPRGRMFDVARNSSLRSLGRFMTCVWGPQLRGVAQRWAGKTLQRRGVKSGCTAKDLLDWGRDERVLCYNTR